MPSDCCPTSCGWPPASHAIPRRRDRVGSALAGLAVWIASPIDLIPEFVPVVGPLDDIVVAAIVLRWVGRRVGEDALRAHWPGSDDGVRAGPGGCSDDRW